MNNRQKNIENNLQNKLFAVLLSVPNSCNYTASKYIATSLGTYPCFVSTLCSYGCLATERIRPFFVSIYAKFLSNVCQTATKICTRRQVRRKQTSSRRNRLHSSALQRRRSLNFSEVTSIGRLLLKVCTVVQHRSWVSGARMLSEEERHRSRNSRKNSKRWRTFTGIDNAESFPTMRALSIM